MAFSRDISRSVEWLEIVYKSSNICSMHKKSTPRNASEIGALYFLDFVWFLTFFNYTDKKQFLGGNDCTISIPHFLALDKAFINVK